ncbi:flavodoxin [Peribacillus tepidiphilus]|uniref:flavodoxin n=1 Tax=Peribacillus tepidiphilus TaxID=2652445 RepID=UPI0035B534CD
MKVFIGYVSMSGNTEDIAQLLLHQFQGFGCDVDIEELDTLEVETLKDYDLNLIGAYTWGDGDLPYEAEEFFEDLDHIDLHDTFAACFGSGDRAYPQFCAAVDILAEKLEVRGASVFDKRLKMELSPETDEEINDCKEFALSVYEWMKGKKG